MSDNERREYKLLNLKRAVKLCIIKKRKLSKLISLVRTGVFDVKQNKLFLKKENERLNKILKVDLDLTKNAIFAKKYEKNYDGIL